MKGPAIVKTFLCDCSDGWLALDISHSCRKARRQGKAMIKVQVFFLLHPRFSFACLFLVNFDSSDQVTGLAATVGKVSRQAFLQLAEGVQVASLDLTQTHPSLNPVMTCVLDTSWSCCQWQVKQVLPRKHNRMLPHQHHCQPHIHWMGLRSRTKNH